MSGAPIHGNGNAHVAARPANVHGGFGLGLGTENAGSGFSFRPHMEHAMHTTSGVKPRCMTFTGKTGMDTNSTPLSERSNGQSRGLTSRGSGKSRRTSPDMASAEPPSAPQSGLTRPPRSTPAASAPPTATPGLVRESIQALRRSMPTRLRRLLVWRNPVESALALSFCALTLTTVHMALTGHLSALSVVCNLLLARLAVSFCSALLSKQKPAPTSAAWAATIAKASEILRGFASVYDSVVRTDDPKVTLAAAAGLWALAIAGRYVSVMTLAWTALVTAFTVSPAYAAHRPALHRIANNAAAAAGQRFRQLGLTRKQKALGLVLGLSALWSVTSWTNRAVAVFIAVVSIRCHMRPTEVEAVQDAAAPYTQSIHRGARTLSRTMQACAEGSLARFGPGEVRS
ncbi:unnamed protein product [Pedinophyceae sp. YPF-701]|nr:unnamed protein product [Pedinophyceae sp. YPF-701]